MTTKLKIDLTQGILEVEGSETFVKAIYSDFKVHFIGDEAGEMLGSKTRRGRPRSTRTKPEKKSIPAVESNSSPTSPDQPESEVSAEPEPAKPMHQFLEDLPLTAGEGRGALVEFMDLKFPITNEERNLVFLYYIQHVLKIKPIKADHIYTCYRAAKIRVPLNLESSLETTVNQRRWIKKTKTGRLSVTPSGKLYVEKQLPKKLKS
jgi:hypothetical protein